MSNAETTREPFDPAVLFKALFLGVIAIFVLVPLLATLLGGFKSLGELRVNPFGLPRHWEWQNYADILFSARYWQLLRNSLIVSTLTTNLMGPIRLTGALVGHLKQQGDATIINVSSVLGFVPMAISGVYSSTKAAIHSYTQSLRYKLKDTSVRVVEIAPPWVQTDLLDSKNEPRAMPLAPFIEQTMHELGTDADEAIVEIARPLRNNPGPNEAAFVTQFNDMFAGV